MLSIFYSLSALGVICTLLFLPKSSKKQECAIWLPVCYIAYECIISFVAGIFTIIHIPVNLVSIGTTNILICCVGVLWIKKTALIQDYYLRLENILFYIFLSIITVFVGYERYGNGWQICFETSDPGTHLKMAMDTVNSQSVLTPLTTMFLTPVTNGIFIRVLMPFFCGTDVYKSFLIKELYYFFLSGATFYSFIYRHLKTFTLRVFGMGMAVFYIFGYPYNNLLFGFSYLGFAVTITVFLLFVTDVFLTEKRQCNTVVSFMSLGCFGVAQCYTMFAPLVFIGIFCCIAYKVKRDNGCVIVSRQFYKRELQVFLMPTLLTIWFAILYPRISNEITGSNYGSVLTWEGYTYRNLYADFFIYFPVVLYAVSNQIKSKKWSANSWTFLAAAVYTVGFFLGMYYGKISTYYYYKLNFLIWMIVLSLFVEGICIIHSNMKEFAICYCGCWGIVFLLWFTRWDVKLNEKNVLFNPFANAKSCYEIFDFNRIIRERKSSVSKDLVQLCREVNSHYKKEGQVTIYLGNWLDNYWYEALTNQRQPMVDSNELEGFFKNFADGDYGDYLAVEKNDEILMKYCEWIQDYEVMYENNYGLIINRSKSTS